MKVFDTIWRRRNSHSDRTASSPRRVERRDLLGLEHLEGRECPTVTFADFFTPNPPDPMLTPAPVPNPGNLNELRFTPLTFASEAQPPTLADSEASDISFTITAGAGNALDVIDVSQFFGDTTVVGFEGASAESNISTVVTVTITQLDGTTPVSITNAASTLILTYTNGGVFNVNDQTYVNFPFEGTGSLDVDDILAAAGLTAGRASQVSVRIQTILETQVSETGYAFIALKDAAVEASEQPLQPVVQANAFLAGIVYVDANNNGVVDPKELGIAGVTIFLFQGNNLVAQTTTDQFGYYQFTDLTEGTYTVKQQPQSDPPLNKFIDGKETLGNLGGVMANDQMTVTLGPNSIGVGYNFGERGLKAKFVTKRSFTSSTINTTGSQVLTGLIQRFGDTTNLPLVNAFMKPKLNFNAVDFALALGIEPVNQNNNGGNV